MKRYVACLLVMILLWPGAAAVGATAKDDDFTGSAQAHDSLADRLRGRVVTKGDILFKEGMARKAQGDYEGALYKWQDAIRAFETKDKGLNYMTLGLLQLAAAVRDEKEKIPAVYIQMGDVYLDMNDYSNALSSFRRGLSVAEANGQDREAGRAMIGLAAAYKELGDDRTAFLYLDKASARAVRAKDQHLQATALQGTADLYLQRRSYPEAHSRYEKILSLGESAKDRALVGSACYGLGLSLAGRGRHGEALPFFERSLTIARERKDMTDVVDALNAIGFCHLSLKNYDRARRAYTESVSLISVLELMLPAQRSSANHGLGLVYERTGDAPRALKSLHAAVKDIEGIRGRIAAGEYRTGFFEGKTAVYEDLIDLLMKMSGEAVPGKTAGLTGEDLSPLGRNFGEISFFFMESTRGRSFLDTLARNKTELLAGRIPRELADRETRLLQTINALQTAGGEGSRTRRDTLNKSQRELEDLIAKLKADYPDYAAIRYPEPVTVRDVPLQEGEVLLAYKVNPQATYLWVVRKGQEARAMRIDVGRDALSRQIGAFRQPLQDITRLQDFDPRPGEALCRLLLGPVLPHLRPEEHIIIIPDGPLHLLPFEALVLEASGKGMPAAPPPGDGKAPDTISYVGERYRISYYPSASVMAIIRKAKGGKQPGAPLLAVADPVYDENDPRCQNAPPSGEGGRGKTTPVAAAGPDAVHLREIVVNSGFALPRLPETREEALKIGALFGLKAGSPAIKLDLDARKSELLKMDLGTYRYLHFATHGLLSGDIPHLQEPALVLTLVGNRREEDGFLKMSDVLGMRMNPDLVVLSACKTALGREIAGEGIVGLSRAFMLAGAKSVVVSLWSVESQSTAELMKAFYAHMQAGMSKEEALRSAKIGLRQGTHRPARERGIQVAAKTGTGGIYESHPFFWAPFILIGEWH
ncbi:MAG TPA: CHAT domain-containing tetratricopeptide repeat protein [Syntrophales bacterium]|nr:CHAT domain-containing tetratricopeptide repeat protein [Syntrophales bacterium]HRR47990.1 CHAT domain-containing tetratricopeptide repeat protein [Syntrophales bacterium]